ncbi:MAG: threonyl-tRNA synthetase editing domain-containing protein [Candidatus Staskawiczbacteria bacterium]|jgi:threonyl-tRNA synthetase
MKILMWHCKIFDVNITGVSDRPKTIQPEEQRAGNERMENCIVAMITIEVQDDGSKAENGQKEIIKFADDTKVKNIVLMPFVHLSNNIADSKVSVELIDLIEVGLKDKFSILKSHFGYHKELLLYTFGHKTNVRFREF